MLKALQIFVQRQWTKERHSRCYTDHIIWKTFPYIWDSVRLTLIEWDFIRFRGPVGTVLVFHVLGTQWSIYFAPDRNRSKTCIQMHSSILNALWDHLLSKKERKCNWSICLATYWCSISIYRFYAFCPQIPWLWVCVILLVLRKDLFFSVRIRQKHTAFSISVLSGSGSG